MRQRFVHVLQIDEEDSASGEVLRRFWARAKPLPARLDHRPPASVVDLAEWASRHRVER